MPGHRLACVSAADLVILEARVNVPEKYKLIFAEILNAVSSRSSNLSGINARDRELLVALQSAKNAQLLLGHALRELAFGFNANFCAAPAGHKVTLRKENDPLWQGPWCKNPTAREFLIADIRLRLSEELYTEHMKSIIEMPASTDYSDSSAIVALHDQIWGCHIENLNQIQPNKAASLNACDRARFKRLMWQTWIAEYKTRLEDFPQEKKNLFGLNTATYFTLGVNALPNQAAVDANDHSKSLAKIFTLPTETRFIQSGSGAPEQTLLLSFSPASEQMFFTKKDSGSLLSVLGSVPFAALSTIDGEATSGGASITPLPKVEGDEEEELPARRAGGC